MKQIAFGIFLTLSLASVLSAKTLLNTEKSGIAIKGYDPVAYFTENAPIKGSPSLSSTNGGAVYFFSSADHKSLFDAAPTKYEPQYGGFCAYGVSRGALVEIDPSAFQIVNGKLLLQYSRGIMNKFNKDQSACLLKADTNWPDLVERKGK